MWRKWVCTWSSFYRKASAKQTHLCYEVDALDDVDIEKDFDNKLQVE